MPTDHEETDPVRRHVSSHGNVHASALGVLETRGWTVRFLPESTYESDEFDGLFQALRDGTCLLADDPLQLLVLAALAEARDGGGDGPYWWRFEGGTAVQARIQDDAHDQQFLEYLATPQRRSARFATGTGGPGPRPEGSRTRTCRTTTIRLPSRPPGSASSPVP